MTVPATVTDPGADSPPVTTARRIPVHGVVASHVARWTLLLALAAVGFRETWSRIPEEWSSGAGSGLFLAIPVGGALTAVTIRLQQRPSLPIHDRQSDKITGTIVLAIALMIQWMVLPRYANTYVLLHLDVLAAWTFLLGGCVFLFGLRSTGRYWPAWLFILIASPGVLRLLTFPLGGGPVTTFAVSVAVVLAGPAAVAGPDLLRRVARTGGGGRRERPGVRPRATATVVSSREAWRSVPLLVAVALVLGLAPLPQSLDERLAVGPPDSAGAAQVVPSDWQETGTVDYPWAERMFGQTATLHRQTIRSTDPRADWDPLLRPRVAVVQTLTAPKSGVLDVFPLEMTYDLSAARVSPPTPVDLGHSVTGRFRTVIDDEKLLTWSLLSFVWHRSANRAQRVSILTVDDHEYDAEFPETVTGTSSTISRLVALLLRGSGSVTDTSPQAKDLDMLTELGTDLVEAQWTTP